MPQRMHDVMGRRAARCAASAVLVPVRPTWRCRITPRPRPTRHPARFVAAPAAGEEESGSGEEEEQEAESGSDEGEGSDEGSGEADSDDDEDDDDDDEEEGGEQVALAAIYKTAGSDDDDDDEEDGAS